MKEKPKGLFQKGPKIEEKKNNLSTQDEGGRRKKTC